MRNKKLTLKMLLIAAIPILLAGAYIDVIFLGKNSFEGYLLVGSWELFIFLAGFCIATSNYEKLFGS